MTDRNTHAILFELQKNLEDLVSAKVQMEEFRSSAIIVVQGIGNVHENFKKHLSDLESDYKQRVHELEESLTSLLSATKEENIHAIQKVAFVAAKEISKGVEHFSTVANKVESTNDVNILAVTNLLEHYKSVVEASRSLIDTLNAIDFPSKLDALSSKTLLIIESITNAKQALELKSNEIQISVTNKLSIVKDQIGLNTDSKFQALSELLKERTNQIRMLQEKQASEIKILKIISIFISLISIVGVILTLTL